MESNVKSSSHVAKFLLSVRPAILADVIKRMMRIRRKIIDTQGGRFFIDPVSNFGFRLESEGHYEPETEAVLRHYLSPGKVFVDLGANEGYFTVLAAKHCGPSGRVLAIEPQARLLPIIERQLQLNGVAADVLNVAISDAQGTTILHLAPSTNTGGSGLSRSTRYPVATQSIGTMTLTSALASQGIRQVDLLKVDIEGFEYEAILGSPELFQSKSVKAVAIELHRSALAARGKSADAIIEFLRDAGYKCAPEFPGLVWLV